MGKRHDFKEEVITDLEAQNYVLSLHGKALYSAQCMVCHGEDGTASLSGAKNLKVSQKNDSEIAQIIITGKNTMPKVKPAFSEQELKAIVNYVNGLKE